MEICAQENVRYVTAGTPNGWVAMAKTIRDVDEGKVNDCKEDIDTLLVFVRPDCFVTCGFYS